MRTSWGQRVGNGVAVVVDRVVVEDGRALDGHPQFAQQRDQRVAVRRARGEIGGLAFELLAVGRNLGQHPLMLGRDQLFNLFLAVQHPAQFTQPDVRTRDAVGGWRLDLRDAVHLLQRRAQIGAQRRADLDGGGRLRDAGELLDGGEGHDVLRLVAEGPQKVFEDVAAPEVDDVDFVGFLPRGLYDLAHDGVVGRVKAGGQILDLKPSQKQATTGMPQFLGQFVRRALHVVADDARGAGGGDEDGVGMHAFVDLAHNLDEFLRRAEDGVLLSVRLVEK